jgi:hypothetical protein
VNVTRNEDGSHSPAYDETWPPHIQLQWSAGVVAVDTGLHIHVNDLGDDKYAVHVGASGLSPMDLASTYAFLDGVQTGAREARR